MSVVPVIKNKDSLRTIIASYLDGNPNNYVDIGVWDISAVTDMSNLFRNRNSSQLNWRIDTPEKNALVAGISGWNMEHVTNTAYMFYESPSFNQPLNWDVSEVKDMKGMFQSCDEFNQPLDWDVSNVEDMTSMFEDCTSFNGPLNWGGTTSDVQNMSSMFEGCTSFNQPLDWEVSNVVNMSSMFKGCTSFNSFLDFGETVSNVVDASSMFEDCTSFNQILLGWETYSLSDATSMFEGCTSLSQPYDNLKYYTDNMLYLTRMFYNCPNFPRESIVEWECFEPGNEVHVTDIFGPEYDKIILGIPNDLVIYTAVQSTPLQIESPTPSILDRTLYDSIMLEDVTVKDYLNETKDDPDDDKNIVLVLGNLIKGVTRNTLKTIIQNNEGSAIKYECKEVEKSIYITTDKLEDKTTPYFSNNNVGSAGLTPVSQIKYILEHPEITAVKLVESGRAKATVSYQMLTAQQDPTSAAHCQDGTAEIIYDMIDISAGTVGEGIEGKGKKTRRRRKKKAMKTRRRTSSQKKTRGRRTRKSGNRIKH